MEINHSNSKKLFEPHTATFKYVLVVVTAEGEREYRSRREEPRSQPPFTIFVCFDVSGDTDIFFRSKMADCWWSIPGKQKRDFLAFVSSVEIVPNTWFWLYCVGDVFYG